MPPDASQEPPSPAPVYEFSGFRLDPERRLVLRGSQPVPLPPKVFDTLLALVRRSGQVAAKSELMQEVWPDTAVEEANLTQNVFTLRKVLGEGRGDEAFIETVTRRGYRFLPEVRVVSAEATGIQTATASRLAAARWRPGPRVFASLAVAMLMVAAVLLGLRSRSPSPRSRSLAILPLANLSGDPQLEYLADGVAESLIRRVSRVSGLRVMAPSVVFRFKNRLDDPRKVGWELGVDTVLSGKIVTRSGSLSMDAELMDVSDGSLIWGASYEMGPAGSLTALPRKLPAEVATALGLPLAAEDRGSLARSDTESTEAYHAYLKGLYFWRRHTAEDLSRAIRHFDQAIASDPQYALAYAGLARALNVMTLNADVAPHDVMPRAKAAALRALALEPDLAEARVALGGVQLRYEWDWPGAVKSLENGNEAFVPGQDSGLASYLAAMGRTDEAVEAGRRFVANAPLDPMAHAMLARDLYYARRFDEAVRESRAALELEPRFWIAQLFLGKAREQQGRYEEARLALQAAAEASGDLSEPVALLAHLQAVAGRPEEARRILERLRARERYVPPHHLALVHAGLGEHEQAFAWLEKAYADRNYWMIYLKVEPKLDRLRRDPRFDDLLGRMHLSS